MPESGTFLHIELDFNFNLLLARASNVSLEPLDLVASPLVLVLEIFHFALQIYDKMSVRFKGAADAICREFGALRRQAIASLLLKNKVIDDLILAL